MWTQRVTEKKCRKCPCTCPSSCLFFIYLLELTAVWHYGAIQHHYPSAEFLSVLSLALSSSSLCWFSVRQLPRVGRRKSCSGCWGLCTCLISFTVACLPPSLWDWRERRASKIFPALLEMILQAHVRSAFCSALCNPWRAVSELGLMRVWQGRLQVVHAWQWQRSSASVWLN